MASNAKNDIILGEKNKITKHELKERIEAKLITRGVSNPEHVTDEQLYHATVHVLKDIMLEYRTEFKKRIKNLERRNFSCLQLTN